MNNKNILSVSILASAIIISGAVVNSALALNPFDIQFPVKELGNCQNMEACKVYCDKPQNVDACLAFAEKNNLASKEDIEMAKKFKDMGLIGPGGCKGQVECDNYCGNPDNMSECITFAEKNGLMPPEQLKEARKVQAAIAKGIKPPACKGKKACDTYCSSSEHMEECMNFAIEAGMMSGKELDDSKKVLQAVKRGIKPPACKGKEECDTYCSSSEHMEECMNFAIEAGMMPEQERENSQKMLQALKKGVKPPNCKGKKECDAYCQSEEHMEECINFSVAAGMMTEKDAAMAKKTKGKGPGGCVGRDACDAFCNNSDNQETCFEFGKEHGMIPEDDLERMDEGRQGVKESFNRMSQEVLTCLSSSLDAATLEKLKAGTGMLTPKTGEAMDKCFRQFAPQGQMGQGGPMEMPSDLKDCLRAQIGENGLAKLQSENVNDPALMEKAKTCFEKYGQQNQQGQPGQPGQNRIENRIENRIDQGQPGQNQQGQPGDKFQPGSGTVNPGGQQMPQQAGPGGCKGPEECQKYCASNPDECKNMGQGGGQFAPGTGPGNIEGQPGQPGNQLAPGTDSAGGGVRQFMKRMKDKIFVPGDQQQQFAPGTGPADLQRPMEKRDGQQSGSQTGNVSESNPQPSPAPDMIRTQTMQQGQFQQQFQGDQTGQIPMQQGTSNQIQPGQIQNQMQPNQQMQPGQIQTGQMAPGGIAPSPSGEGMMQQQLPMQQQTPPPPTSTTPPPSSFIQKLLGNVIGLFR